MSTPVPWPAAQDYADEDPWREQPDRDGPTNLRFDLSGEFAGQRRTSSLPMNSRQHRCMNQASASETQVQQSSLNSSLGDTIGSPLVHLAGQFLSINTSILRKAFSQSSFTSVIYGPWFTTVATSLILDSPILICTVYCYHGGTRTVHKLRRFGNVSIFGPKANDHVLLDMG
ncbi:uncharacterized protein TNCV_2312521 [Trichonephila clavipes]|nr:uncharacterized protein TNCV_2312521 [Trichonephila clavipes]